MSRVINGNSRVVIRSTQEYFYKEFFGGVIAISPDHFQKTNGFSNMFWGWGSEDDDFYKR